MNNKDGALPEASTVSASIPSAKESCVTEFYIEANSFAAPFFSDQSHGYVEATDAAAALTQWAAEYTHPCGLYAAVAYSSADAHNKGEQPLARWLSNQAQRLEGVTGMIRMDEPGKGVINGEAVVIEDPKAGCIAEHEEEPVDPLLIEAREIAAQAMKATFPDVSERVLNRIRSGDEDCYACVTAAYAALRRGRELAQPVTVASLYGYEAGLVEGARAQWQPIESAPKDGTEILLFSPESETMIVASWEENTSTSWHWMTLDGPSYHEKFATHWMPLPSPPSIADGAPKP